MTHIQETYYVVCDYGKLGRETIINWEDDSKRSVLVGLERGEYKKPIEVHCIDRNDGTWRDVSEDIAREVVAALQSFPDGDLFDFLENHLGCQFMAELGREMKEGRSDFDEHNTLNRAQQGV